MVSVWNLLILLFSRLKPALWASRSDALEIVEWLQAGAAAVQRLAGGGAELADHFGVLAAALRAADRVRLAEQAALAAATRRRGDAVDAQALAALGADPVGGPGRRQAPFDARGTEAGLLQRPGDLAFDQLGGRAAGVGRGDDHPQVAVVPVDLADDAEVDHADHRHFRVHHLLQHLARAWRVGCVRLARAAVGGDRCAGRGTGGAG